MSSNRPQYGTLRRVDDYSERSYRARSPRRTKPHGENGQATFQQDHDSSSRSTRSPARQHTVPRDYRWQDRSRSRTREHSPVRRGDYRSRSGSIERHYGNYTTDRRAGHDNWRPAQDTYRPRPSESASVSSNPADRSFNVEEIPYWRKMQLRDKGAEPESDNERGYVAWLENKANHQIYYDSWSTLR